MRAINVQTIRPTPADQWGSVFRILLLFVGLTCISYGTIFQTHEIDPVESAYTSAVMHYQLTTEQSNQLSHAMSDWLTRNPTMADSPYQLREAIRNWSALYVMVR